ncbi:hypothetical protein PilKf_01322 [Pillotina sp. SPG140]
MKNQKTEQSMNRVRKIAVTGVLAALTVVLGITGIGFVTWFPGVSLTIMHVPVLIGAILEGPIVGTFVGLLFGLFSLIQASIIAVNPGDLAFINPLISVVPRLFIGPATYAVYILIKGQSMSSRREYGAMIIGSIAGSLVNTVLVLGMLGVFKIYPWTVIAGVALTNGPIEAVFAAVLVATVLSMWHVLSWGKNRSRLSKEALK